MRRHWLSGPNRADLFCRVVADRKDKVHLRCSGQRELVPSFAPQPGYRKFRGFDLANRRGMHGAFRLASGAKRSEIWETLSIQDGFGHDRPRRVPRAQKQNVVATLHSCVSIRASFSVAAGWTAASLIFGAGWLNRSNERAH